MAEDGQSRTEQIRTALLGREDGTRQRILRRVKKTATKMSYRAMPEKVDAAYTNNLAKAAGAEFISVLIFVFVGAGAVESLYHENLGLANSALVVGAALAHGFGLAIAVAISAAASGGHVNPAVTFGFIVTGRIDALSGLVYIVSQLVAATLAGFLLWLIWGAKYGLGAHSFGHGVSSGQGLLTEVILTFILVTTIWATDVDPRGNKTMAPYFIGLAVFLGVLFGFPITGGSMNPARTFGIAVVSGNFDHHWVYWIGPLFGAAVAALIGEFVYVRTAPEMENEDYFEVFNDDEPEGAAHPRETNPTV